MTANTSYEIYEIPDTPHFFGVVEKVPQFLQDRGDYKEWENWMVIFETFDEAFNTLKYISWLEETYSTQRI